MEQQLIAGIAHDKNEARVTLTGVPDKPGTVRGDLRSACRGQHQRRHDRPVRRRTGWGEHADLHGSECVASLMPWLRLRRRRARLASKQSRLTPT